MAVASYSRHRRPGRLLQRVPTGGGNAGLLLRSNLIVWTDTPRLAAMSSIVTARRSASARRERLAIVGNEAHPGLGGEPTLRRTGKVMLASIKKLPSPLFMIVPRTSLAATRPIKRPAH